MSQLTHEAFAANRQTSFRVQVGTDQHVDLELMEVSELKLSERQEQFSIVFRGPSDAYLGQGIRPFHHERMGQFDLFIVPIRQDEKGFYYEAVFNRLPEPAETT